MSTYSSEALAGRTALVIGAAQGIGAAVTSALAAAGATVIGADLKSGDGIEPVDVMSEDSIGALMGKVGPRLDVLVYGAAHLDPATQVPDLATDLWQRVLAVNLTGAFLTCKHAIPLMKARTSQGRGGSIVLIASQLGSVGSPGRAAYCSTKGALIQLAKVLAIDHAKDGIRANTLSPGAVATQRLEFRYGSIDEANRAIGPKHLLNRIAAPSELAEAAVFLASDASSFMTGADLLVDGGYNAV